MSLSKTPVKPRFLLSKRQPPQSQQQFLPLSQTQKQDQTPVPRQQAQSQQFASTPRFNVSSTAAATAGAASSSRATVSNYPPAFSTPAPGPPPSARQPSTQKASKYEFLHDAIDSSPISSAVREDDGSRDRQCPLNESIDIDSPSSSRSLLSQNSRPAKRQRVSINHEIEPSPDDEEDEEGGYNHDYMEVDDEEPTEEGIITFAKGEQGEDGIETQSTSSSPGKQSGYNHSSSPSPVEPAARHPTFHKAPRFKVTELAENNQKGLLPDAFSPQRRGARYMPGGLAAELREWLVQVKGASEYDRPTASSIEAIVDDARSGNGMWLIAAHEKDDTGQQHDEDLARVILAGDGRITGLGGRNSVRPGTTISIHQPMWDLQLNDLGHFAVACDWEVPE